MPRGFLAKVLATPIRPGLIQTAHNNSAAMANIPLHPISIPFHHAAITTRQSRLQIFLFIH